MAIFAICFHAHLVDFVVGCFFFIMSMIIIILHYIMNIKECVFVSIYFIYFENDHFKCFLLKKLKVIVIFLYFITYICNVTFEKWFALRAPI